MKKVIIVGGVAGGASAAARLRRLDEKAQIVIFERGEYISFANCGLPYYIGGVIKDRKRLIVSNPEFFKARFNITVHTKTEVLSVNPSEKTIEVKNLDTGEKRLENYDNLILSPGAFPAVPKAYTDIPGVFSLRNIKDMDKIHKFIEEKSAKTAVVVGGGFIGLEMVENLSALGLSVTLVQRRNQVMKHLDFEMSAVIHEQLRSEGVNLLLSNPLKSIQKTETGLEIKLENESCVCDIVVMALGVKPEVELAREAGLKIGKHGGISVDKYLKTSNADIYAVGDAIEVKNIMTGENVLLPLAGPANKEGRIAADNICGEKKAFSGVQGTEIVHIFDLSVAKTGLAEKEISDKTSFYTSVIHAMDHAGYYPGASPMTMKLVFSKKDGKILGAQIVGKDGVDKRIDVLATAIRGGMTVYDLTELELAYAPQYSSAKDPVNMLGFTAENIIKGKVKTVSWDKVDKLPSTYSIIDVRTPHEFAAGAIKGAKNFPLDNLRSSLKDLPDGPLFIYCAAGLRGYIACRILTQNGFDEVVNLSGGYRTYKLSTTNGAVNLGGGGKTLKSTQRDMEKTEMSKKKTLDVCGMACPMPIVLVYNKLGDMEDGEILEVSSTDPGFFNDIGAWCEKTGNTLLELKKDEKTIKALIKKGLGEVPLKADSKEKKATFVLFSCDLDKVMGAFIIATGAATIGKEVTMFFTFWGLNVLRKTEAVPVKKNIIEKMFGFMMPKGHKALTLSKMNMGGMGTSMMRSVMKQKNVPSLEELMEQAAKLNIRMVACQMSMDIMGIKKEELIDGVELAGVGSYIANADDSGLNLFI